MSDVIGAHWEIKGQTIVSVTSLIPSEQLIGTDRRKNIVKYHPKPGSAFYTERINNDTQLKLRVTTGDGWPENTANLINSLTFVMAPGGMDRLVVMPIDPKYAKIDGNWVLHNAKVTKGSDDTALATLTSKLPQEESSLIAQAQAGVKSLILQWTVDTYDEFVFSCWKWP